MIASRTFLFAFLTLGAGASGALIGRMIDRPAFAQSARELTGDRLTLVDQHGNVRASLGLSGGNQQYTYFYLNDARGRPRVRFTVAINEQPRVEFLDAHGAPISSSWGTQVRSFAEIRPHISPTYRAPSGPDEGFDPGKGDFAPPLRLPRVSPTPDVTAWLNAHNLALLGLLRARFDSSDMTQFTRAERSACSNNVFCEMAYRQHAIGLIWGR